MKCPKCQKNVIRKQKFCGYCGANIDTGESQDDMPFLQNLRKKTEEEESIWEKERKANLPSGTPKPKLEIPPEIAANIDKLGRIPDETEVEMRMNGLWVADAQSEKIAQKAQTAKEDAETAHLRFANSRAKKGEELLKDLPPLSKDDIAAIGNPPPKSVTPPPQPIKPIKPLEPEKSSRPVQSAAFPSNSGAAVNTAKVTNTGERMTTAQRLAAERETKLRERNAGNVSEATINAASLTKPNIQNAPNVSTAPQPLGPKPTFASPTFSHSVPQAPAPKPDNAPQSAPMVQSAQAGKNSKIPQETQPAQAEKAEISSAAPKAAVIPPNVPKPLNIQPTVTAAPASSSAAPKISVPEIKIPSFISPSATTDVSKADKPAIKETEKADVKLDVKADVKADNTAKNFSKDNANEVTPEVAKPNISENSKEVKPNEKSEKLTGGKTIKLPDFKTQTKENANSALVRLGLRPVLKTVNDETAPNGTVVTQEPAPDTMLAEGELVTLRVSVGTWSKWTKDPYIRDDKHEIESKTIFRSRSREQYIEYKESEKSVMEGYTLYDSKKEYSNWETDRYYSKSSSPPSETCEILKMNTGFKYFGWTYHGIDSVQGTYCSKEMALYFNPQTEGSNWEYEEVIDKLGAEPEYKKWTPSEGFESSPAGDKVSSNICFMTYYVGGIEYAGKTGTSETVWAKYRKRKMGSVKYKFKAEKYSEWSDWSEWSLEADCDADELHDVEKQTLYRRRRKAN